MSVFSTEFDFTLPNGYTDSEGNLHREGAMRLATAADEILPLRHPRVVADPAYLMVIVLARVIVRFGTLEMITPRVIEELHAEDFDFLKKFYMKVNEMEVDT